MLEIHTDDTAFTGPPLRVLIVTESFLPQVNGVTNSVCRVLEELQRLGHHAEVIAPTGPKSYAGAAVHRVGGFDLPGYDGFTLGTASQRRLTAMIKLLDPDVVHVASPFVLGYAAVRAAKGLNIPVVSVYQTDMIGLARRYRMRGAEALVARRVRRIHNQSDLTLVPSAASMTQLHNLGIARLHHWPRGVDTQRFTPAKRDTVLHADLTDPTTDASGKANVVIGYVGRLAKEKNLHHLAPLQDLPGVQLVLVGEGPEQTQLQRLLPRARFLGVRQGEELAALLATFDIFVHPGTEETFCQSVQEALASGVPAVGPAAGGLNDRISHGRTGFHYPPGDISAFHRAVARLVSNPRLRDKMGSTARQLVMDCSWSRVVALLVSHYHYAMAAADSVTQRPTRAVAQYDDVAHVGI